jgi:hypothetical protein
VICQLLSGKEEVFIQVVKYTIVENIIKKSYLLDLLLFLGEFTLLQRLQEMGLDFEFLTTEEANSYLPKKLTSVNKNQYKLFTVKVPSLKTKCSQKIASIVLTLTTTEVAGYLQDLEPYLLSMIANEFSWYHFSCFQNFLLFEGPEAVILGQLCATVQFHFALQFEERFATFRRAYSIPYPGPKLVVSVDKLPPSMRSLFPTNNIWKRRFAAFSKEIFSKGFPYTQILITGNAVEGKYSQNTSLQKRVWREYRGRKK